LIGGLTSSLLLTLFIVPLVYTKVEEYRLRIPVLFKRVSELLRIKKRSVVPNSVAEDLGLSK
jgi:hypothetical protein